MTGTELAKACADYVNSYSCIQEEFASAMSRQHRTLQQSFTRMIVAYLCMQAQETDDLRNRDSIEFSKKVIKLLEDEKIVFPLI